MRIVFMGTPDFAVPCLRALIEAGHEIAGVFTQPDKPVGRHAVLTAPPVKQLALQHGLPVFQPTRMRDGAVAAQLRDLAPDLAVVTAYGRILPQEVLEAPRLGCMNVHASLLPKYRGAAPIQWCILNGDGVTGVTTMQMDAGMDTGDIIEQTETPVGENETAGELFDRLSVLGAELMLSTVRLFERGSVPRRKQEESAATHVTMLQKEMGRLDFSLSAREVHNKIRGMNPWPSAFLGEGGAMLKFHRSLLCEGSGAPGELLDDRRMIVACGQGALEITEVQPAGKGRMSGADYLRGARLRSGDFINR